MDFFLELQNFELRYGFGVQAGLRCVSGGAASRGITPRPDERGRIGSFAEYSELVMQFADYRFTLGPEAPDIYRTVASEVCAEGIIQFVPVSQTIMPTGSKLDGGRSSRPQAHHANRQDNIYRYKSHYTSVVQARWRLIYRIVFCVYGCTSLGLLDSNPQSSLGTNSKMKNTERNGRKTYLDV